MSGFKDTLKGGWHPKGKDGKKESWRGDFKGVDQVAGWMGKKKSPVDEANEHVSRPLHQLKDPAAFGPPPKHVNYHGGIALPNQTTPDRSGLGAPLSRAEIEAKQQAEEEEEREAEEAAKRKGPPVPFRADRTGISTANLPPPPGHKDRRPVGAIVGAEEPIGKPKPPGLPPRLPPRQNSASSTSSIPPTPAMAVPDAHRGVLNQGALSRLGAAGVSVPGLGIGGAKSKPVLPPPSTPSPSRSPAPPASAVNSAQLGELQSRFSRFSASSSPKPDAPSEGTTFAQKQAALKTASSFRNDPSSVSLSDARAAATTANNFRERHGEQVKSGWQSANKLNTKYGIADKVGSYGIVAPAQESENIGSKVETKDNTIPLPAVMALAKKKPPPPPPMKRAALSGAGVPQASQPPPIPLASKPKPQVSSNYQ